MVKVNVRGIYCNKMEEIMKELKKIIRKLIGTNEQYELPKKLHNNQAK